MRISDHFVSEVMIDIAYYLSDRWSTDMSDMKRFTSIRTDIVDYYSFSIWLSCSLYLHLWEDISPYFRSTSDIHISTDSIHWYDIICIFAELSSDLFGYDIWRLTERFR